MTPVQTKKRKSPCFQLNFQQEAHNQVNKYTEKRLKI